MSFARRSTNARQIPVKTEPRVSIVSTRSNVFVPMDILGPGANNVTRLFTIVEIFENFNQNFLLKNIQEFLFYCINFHFFFT